MKRRNSLCLGLAAAALLVSGVAFAGGCLQGTWHYYDSQGRLVGGQTVGCGAMDGAWGKATANKTFSQGCSSDM